MVRHWEAFDEYLDAAHALDPVPVPDKETVLYEHLTHIGEGLRVNCWARDRVIEGVEANDGRPILAVQCHPEECSKDYPLFQRLFDWLVDEADGRRK